MAVFTEVSTNEAQDLLRRLQLGTLVELRGIEGGIENTNYFLTSDQGEFVLTLFRRLQRLKRVLDILQAGQHGRFVRRERAFGGGLLRPYPAARPAAVEDQLG